MVMRSVRLLVLLTLILCVQAHESCCEKVHTHHTEALVWNVLPAAPTFMFCPSYLHALLTFSVALPQWHVAIQIALYCIPEYVLEIAG